MRSRSTPRFADLLALAALAIACAACHGPAPRPSRPEARGARASEGLALLASIPGRASACVLTRPTLLTDARRRLLARFRAPRDVASLGYVLDGHGGSAPRVLAYASCRVSMDGTSRDVARLRLAEPITSPDARAGLEEGLPYRVRWRDEPCDALTCGRRTIEIVAPDTVEIVSADAWEASSDPDIRGLLAAEVVAQPSTVEVSAQPLRDLVLIELVERAPRGIAIARRLRARAGESAILDAPLLAALASDGDDDAPGWRLRGDVFERFWPLPWSEIEVRVADQDLERSFRVRRAARDRVVPMDEIDLDVPSALFRQASARALAARVARQDERRRVLTEERALLLQRLFELTGDVSRVLEAVGALGEIGDASAAHALVERALDQSPDDASLREALLSSAPDGSTLARDLGRLRPDLSEMDRSSLGATAFALRSMGVSFATVEASMTVRDARAPAPSARVEPLPLPIESLVEVAYLLLRAPRAGEGAETLSIRLEGPLRVGAPEGHDRLAVRWPHREGASWTLLEGPSTLRRLRWESSLLRAQLPDDGDVTLSAWLRDGEGASRALSLRLRIRGAEATLIGASLTRATTVWSALARDVLRPAAGLDVALFPPPVLHLALRDDQRSSLVARLSSPLWRTVSCEARGGVLACTGDEGPDGLLEVLALVASDTLGP